MIKETDIIILDEDGKPWYITQEEFKRYFQPEYATVPFDELGRRIGCKVPYKTALIQQSDDIGMWKKTIASLIDLCCYFLIMTMLLPVICVSAFQIMKSFFLMLRQTLLHQPPKDWLDSIRQWDPLLPPSMSRKDIPHWKVVVDAEHHGDTHENKS